MPGAFYSKNGVEVGHGWFKSQANVVYSLSNVVAANVRRGDIRLLGVRVASRPHVEVTFVDGGAITLDAENLEQAEEMRQAITNGLAGAAAGPTSVADELSRLSALRTTGVLTDSDWERAKDLYLGKRPSEREASIEELRQLHKLFCDGALSESEFNTRKWDVLVRQR